MCKSEFGLFELDSDSDSDSDLKNMDPDSDSWEKGWIRIWIRDAWIRTSLVGSYMAFYIIALPEYNNFSLLVIKI